MEKENKIMKLGFIGTGNMAGAIMGGIIGYFKGKPKQSAICIWDQCDRG